MPITPIIIPMIVAGITLGSLLVSKTRKISKKRLLTASLVSGLLNAAYAYVVYTLAPPTTFTRGAFTGGTFAGGTFTGAFTGGGGYRAAAGAGATSEPSFLLSSFVTGFLIVLAIVVVALAYVRFKGGKSEEEEASETEQTDETDETDETEETKLEEN